jgi:uncharacterized RDD family membrane protein YckC
MPENIFCSKCGTQNSGTAQFCQRCGVALWPSPASAPSAPSQAAPVAATPAAQLQSSYAPPPPAYVPAAASPYGGFWIRLLAHIIDHIVVSVIAGPLYFILIFPSVMRIMNEAEQNGEPSPEVVASIVGSMAIFIAIVFFGQWLYEALLTSSSWQGTIGKRVLRLKVTDENGNRIGFGRSTGRFFAKIISGLIMWIGFIMIGFTDKKRGLHDMIAGTLVMKY